MNVRLYIYIFLLLIAACSLSANNHSSGRTITPNDFTGSDAERIQAAVNAARGTTCKIVIPKGNANGSNSWKIDRAENRDQEPPSVVSDQCTGIRVLHAPADSSVAFAGFNEVANMPVTSFVAQCSRLKEVYIWIHEELSGLVGAHIIQGGLYGKVIAIGSVQLAFSTPRGWLEQGKRINISNAPTLFGKIDYQIRSDIDKGIVHVTISMPDQAGSASEVSLRLRTPGNKKIKKVKINGKTHKAFNVENETIDLTGKTGLLQLSVHY